VTRLRSAFVPTPLKVAVCTRRRPAEAAECLSALLGEAPLAALAVVTSGLREEAVDAHRSAFRGKVLAEPREGLSRARNRALAWCEAGDALAFVDDDAVVDPRWYEALQRRWESADPDVAVIGGPIRPRYDAAPPAWLSDPLLPALTLIDLGEDVVELDPFVTTVYGANISFRVAALRAVGGFDPAFGHSAARVFFSEEDEAQRALARRGQRVLYVPDAGVRHVVGAERLSRGSFVRRRFAYGRTLGVRRARSLSLATRQALSSSAGAVVAALTGRDTLFMERAVRAAENAGVLYGSIRPRRIA
jgi:GT2 family glycosyltransferase